MNRRQFGLKTGSFLGLGIAGTTTIALRAAIADTAPVSPASTKRETPAARPLYHRALVVDCNLAPDLDGHLPLPKETIDTLRSSGVTVMKSTMGGFDDSLESALGEIAFFQQLIEVHPDVFMQVRRPGDFATAKRDNKLGIIFSFEGVGMLEGKLDRIELFRQLGVRVMQLSYNNTSVFGSGVMVSADSSGLTELGHAAVAKMNELGVAVDLSHANPATTREAMAASTRPVLITHGGCSAIHPHPRNKTEEQLRALADKGGVIGIYDLPYLTASPRQPEVKDYIDHMAHALSVCGEDHVGIGSDQSVQPFDTSAKGLEEFQKAADKRHAAGVAAPEEDRPLYVVGLNIPNRCEVIADHLLQRGYPARVTEKVLGGNFVRAFGEIWKA
ncbi:MAG TPA: membrane dipeptidase [Steroidobacteraceae bacterium]|nr:membrane dipeptidase [Steroidobacteraceae bacterium]